MRNIYKMALEKTSVFVPVTILLHKFHQLLRSEEVNGCGVTIGADVRPCLEILVPKVLSVLSVLHISHFLCYHALWGAIKLGEPLPWVNKVEFCVKNEELMKFDEGHLVRTFRQRGLNVHYDAANGLYYVRLTAPDANVDTAEGNQIRRVAHQCEVYLYVFELTPSANQRVRIGFKHRLLSGNSQSAHVFPAQLVDQPMSEQYFMGVAHPVPHEGFEIQKYLFPNSWWKDLKGPDCS